MLFFPQVAMRFRFVAILVVFADLASVCAQQAAQSSKVSYDGQQVATVDLVANPKISTEALKPLVQQKAGEPYSSAKVQASIAALKQTNRFSKVDIVVKPSAGGLHLTFTLEPALYFGIVQFPGAAKTFTYTRLLQVVDIPNQTPYQQKLVDQAQSALVDFLHSAGFFRAQVRSESQFDEPHMLANVMFHIQLGKRAKVGQVEIQGADPAETKKLLHSTRSLRATLSHSALKPGKPYSPKKIDSAVTNIKSELVDQHRLANKVHFDKSQYHAETNRADVIINAQPGPVVNVSVRGAKLSKWPFLGKHRMKKLIPIYAEGAIDPDLIEEGRSNLVDFFQSKGYFDAKVTVDQNTKPQRIDLVYNVVTGKKHRVEQVAFRGNMHYDKGDLSQAVLVKARKPILSRGKFSNALVRKSVQGITNFYKEHGYEQVKVEPDVVDREPNVYVTFLITEGPQTVVNNLNIEGNENLSDQEIMPPGGFSLREGQPFSPKALTNDRSHILAAYLDRGFLNAEFTSKVDKVNGDPNRVDVTYTITEKQQVRVQDVVQVGRKVTRPSLINLTAQVRTESPLSETNMLTAESQLQSLNVFDWASVSPRRPITDQKTEDVIIKVHEAPRNEVTYGFGFEIAKRGGNLPTGSIALPGLPPVQGKSVDFTAGEKTFVSPRGSVTYSRYNMRGLGETFSGSLLLARLDQRAVITYAQPHFNGSSWSSLYSISAERTTENPTFAARLGEASWQLEKPLNKENTRKVQLHYRFRRTVLSDLTIPGLVLPQDRKLRLSTVSATWLHDTRDKPLDAHRGIYQSFDLGITPRVFGSNTNLARFLGQTSYYKSVFGSTVWASRIMLGLAAPFGTSDVANPLTGQVQTLPADVPTSERFFSGGETTLRGFPINGAGPQREVCLLRSSTTCSTQLSVPVGGKQLFIFNTEYRFPLGIKMPIVGGDLGAAVFYDGGNVYRGIGVSHFVSDFSNTVGFGLRYATPVGPVRIDVGRNLDPVGGIGGTQLFITLGQAF